MRWLFLAIGVAMFGCGSKCDDACAVLANTACPHFSPSGIDVTSQSNCADACRANNDSVCKDNTDSTTNSTVLDCITNTSCGSGALQQLELCVAQCPNANR